ncbi:MAG: CDP-alcohol phosphatidyltransferase family protein [Myxococcota bacterium]
MPSSPTDDAPRAWIVSTPGTTDLRIWGLTPEERLRRALRNAGCSPVEAVSADADLPPHGGAAVVWRGDLIFDPRLVDGLLAAPDAVLWAQTGGSDGPEVPVAAHVDGSRLAEARALLGGAGGAPAGLRRVVPDDLAASYIASLRKALPPKVRAIAAGDVAAVERELFGAAYKSITDLVTKWAWPVPAAAVTRWLAERRVHPNLVTAAGWLLAIAAGWLFAEGRFGWGLVAAWIMTFLDTVDGKLARVTLTSSQIGHVLDHGLDLIHPPFWYFAWGFGVAGGLDPATAVVIAGYLIGRGLEGIFLLAFKMETHCWQPIDSLFRTITARRNPNLILLSVGALAGEPQLGMVMVAIWTVVSIGFHTLRLLQAFAARRRGDSVAPWDEASGAVARPSPANG